MRRGKNQRKDSPRTVLSKKLSWALRHGISKLGLQITPDGYVSVDQLLRHPNFRGVNLQAIQHVVQTNDKKRFALATIQGNLMVRANQGHTVQGIQQEKIFSLIQDQSQFPLVVHGTNKSALPKIAKTGLYRMARNHIHFAIGMPGQGQVISGARKNCQVFIIIDMPRARADGIPFFLSENRVILTPGIRGFLPTKYFKQVIVDRVSQEISARVLDLDYILVLDFQANATNVGKLKCQQIIEFPVQVFNMRTFEVDGTFHYYVKPTVVPDLTPFIIGLTGIQQEQVNNGVSIIEALDLFQCFLEEKGVFGSKWVFLTCGDWDLKVCLSRELQQKKIKRPEYFSYWVNIKNLFPVEAKGMMEMLSVLGLEHLGRHHSGIDDVTNIVQCLRALLESGVRICEDDIGFQIKKPCEVPPYRGRMPSNS